MRRLDEQRTYGRVPRSRRPLYALVLGLVGIAIVVGGVLTSWLSNTPVHWPLLLALLGFVLLAMSIYLWIRLSD